MREPSFAQNLPSAASGSLKRLPEIQARLDAWGVWVTRGGTGSANMHPLARLMDWKSGKRVSVSGDGGYSAYVPVDEIECGLTDEAIAQLPEALRQAVRAWHTCQGGTLETVAYDLGVVRGTLHRRLCQADLRLLDWFKDRRDRQRKGVL